MINDRKLKGLSSIEYGLAVCDRFLKDHIDLDRTVGPGNFWRKMRPLAHALGNDMSAELLGLSKTLYFGRRMLSAPRLIKRFGKATKSLR